MKKRLLIITISTLIIGVICFNTSLSLKQEDKSGTSNLTLSTITALAYGEMTEEEAALARECYEQNRIWDMILAHKGFEDILIQCKKNGELSYYNITIYSDNFKVGYRYELVADIFDCEISPGSCCHTEKVGLYIGGEKVNY